MINITYLNDEAILDAETILDNDETILNDEIIFKLKGVYFNSSEFLNVVLNDNQIRYGIDQTNGKEKTSLAMIVGGKKLYLNSQVDNILNKIETDTTKKGYSGTDTTSRRIRGSISGETREVKNGRLNESEKWFYKIPISKNKSIYGLTEVGFMRAVEILKKIGVEVYRKVN